MFTEAKQDDFTTPLWHWTLPLRESHRIAVPLRGTVDALTHKSLDWPIKLPGGFSFAMRWTWRSLRKSQELVQRKRWRALFPDDSPRPKNWLGLANGFSEPFALRMHVTAGSSLSFCLLLTAGGEPLAYAAREVDLTEHHVEHDFLVIAPDQKGAGLGVRILDNALRFYPRVGIKTIGLMAGLSAGGAVWAKFGFRPVDDSEWRGVKRKVRDNLRRAPPPVLDAFVKKNRRSLAEAVDAILGKGDEVDSRAIWDIVDMDRGAGAIAKMAGLEHGLAALLLRGTRWRGILDLSDAEARERIEAYLATKAVPRNQTPPATP